MWEKDRDREGEVATAEDGAVEVSEEEEKSGSLWCLHLLLQAGQVTGEVSVITAVATVEGSVSVRGAG